MVFCLGVDVFQPFAPKMWMLHCRKIKKIRGDLSNVNLHQSNMIRSDLSHLLLVRLVRGLRDVSMSLRGLTLSSNMVPNCVHYCQVRFGFACPSMSPPTQSCQCRKMND